MPDLSLLFEPFTIKSLTLNNRIVMAPMTRSFSPDATPGEDVAAYYRRRIEGSTGLVITEGTAPEVPAANMDDRVPRFYGERPLAGWKRVIDEVHAAGGHAIPQLWHMGMMRRQDQSPDAELPSIGPSGLHKKNGKQVSEPMTVAQIEAAIEGFANSANYAKELGFDGVEIHGAHGYLVDQFFWEGTNVRTDDFGGDMDRRGRFARDIVKASRQKVGEDFPIFFRFSQWKQQDYEVKLAPTPKDLERFLAPLAEAGVDVFDCSTRRFWQPEFEGSDLNLAGWTKKLTGKATMTVGSVGLDTDFVSTRTTDDVIRPADLDNLLERLERKEFDLVGVGRALISNPDWAAKMKQGDMSHIEPYTREALTQLI